MIKQRVAAITIGQSPREDMTEDSFARLPADLEIVEYGVLDPFTKDEAIKRFSPGSGDDVLVSRLRDGSQIRLAEKAVTGLLQAAIHQAEKEGAAVILLLCTGEFPGLQHGKPLIAPLPLLHGTARALAGGRKIAVLIPDPAQVEPSKRRWRESGLEALVVAASPYEDITKVERAAASLRGSGAALLCLDCIGYTVAMKGLAARASGLPTLLPRTLMSAITAEFLSRHPF
ncbi:MAG: AroM family protein [Peptococcaceae bacterium]|jgi:protein AroM|nr:AroM family protein [Peptococcaceae bacterium]